MARNKFTAGAIVLQINQSQVISFFTSVGSEFFYLAFRRKLTKQGCHIVNNQQ